MLNQNTQNIVLFIPCLVILLVLFCAFIVTLVYRYQQKQLAYFKQLDDLKAAHENALLQTQLEMQEQTFQNISREIHDNIGQKLTLAKLNLNTLNFSETNNTIHRVDDSINMISEAINDLSDISRSMSSEIILNNGLIKGIEFEITQLQKSGGYQINFEVNGNSIFLDNHKELVLFRVVQEALSNIIKHARASKICIALNFTAKLLTLVIRDNGTGFEKGNTQHTGTGLANIRKRTEMLAGTFLIDSNSNGTQLIIDIPLYANNDTI